MTEKYSACLHFVKKVITVKDITMNPPQILPLASNILIPPDSPVSEAVLKSSFMSSVVLMSLHQHPELVHNVYPSWPF